MAPEHSSHGPPASDLVAWRLVNRFRDRDLTLDDEEALQPVLQALDMLGWSHAPAVWTHPDNVRWSQRYTRARHREADRELALLHVPPEVIGSPAADQFRQVKELLTALVAQDVAIRIFSYYGEVSGSVFRSMIRQLQKDRVDIDFRPWRDVREFVETLELPTRGDTPTWLEEQAILDDAARRLLGIDG
jgi:hypothetical protein